MSAIFSFCFQVYSRQNCPKVYELNASIYIWKRSCLLKSDTVFTNKTSYYEMPQNRSVDIDSSNDFSYVEFLMKKNIQNYAL